MAAIDFVVRDGPGSFSHGSVGDGAQPSVILSRGSDVSLNLYPGQVTGYERQGQALVVTLANGEFLVIEGFFDAAGNPISQLYVSAGGELYGVDLAAGEGGRLSANYENGGDFGKFNPDDAFFFLRGPELLASELDVVASEDEGVVGMLGTLGLVGLGLGVIGTTFDGDEDDGDGGRTDGGVGAGGTDGGVGAGGTDGGVGAAGTDGGVGAAGTGGGDPVDPGPDGPGVISEAPVVSISEGTKSVGHVVNATDRNDGVQIGGTGTPGGRIEVTLDNGASRQTTVDDNGDWSVVFAPEDLPSGEYEDGVTVTITNGSGTTTVIDAVVIDTQTFVTFDAASVEGDGTVNASEASDGVVLTGTVEAGATVVVSAYGKTYNAQVTGESWTVTIPPGDVTPGEYGLDVSVFATDAVGNTAETVGAVIVDTVAPEIPKINSTDRDLNGLRGFGITESDENLKIAELGSDGSTTPLDVDREFDARHGEIDLWFDTPVSDGKQLVVSSTDDAGNQNATLFVLDESTTNTVDIANPGLSGFDIGAIDLHFGQSSELTITAADLESLSRNDNTLTVHGGVDDRVTLVGGAALEGSEDGFAIYTLGTEGGRLLIDEDITVIT